MEADQEAINRFMSTKEGQFRITKKKPYSIFELDHLPRHANTEASSRSPIGSDNEDEKR